MPFRSQAQRRKFAQLLVEGKISDQTFEEWNRETGAAKLPEYVRSKTARGAKSPRKKSKSPAKRKVRPTTKTSRKAPAKSRRTRK